MKSQLLLTIVLLIISLSINAEITTDGTLGSRAHLPGPDYQIRADLGQQHGGNLFHSFQDFNLNRSEIATFSGSNNVSNVISRVTGGNPSNIYGLIRSTMPNADMYFLNPYGIVFGENAQLDVQGSFHASTADYLRLGDGGRFDARHPNDSILTVAPISAFGFLTDSPASLSLEGSQLAVPTEKTLSLLAGNLTINQAELKAPFGRINLASVAEFGDVIPKYEDFVVPSLRGDMTISEQSLIETSGEGGGNIFIRSGQLFVSDSDIDAKTLGTQNGGNIDIQANHVSFSEGAVINGHTFGSGTGVNVNIQATESVIFSGENSEERQTRILVRSGDERDKQKTDVNSGNAGTVFIKAKNIRFEKGAGISVSSFTQGRGGNAILNASDDIVFIGESDNRSYIASATAYTGEGAGHGGDVFIEAKNISFIDGAYINSQTTGRGNAGTIKLHAENQLSFTGMNGDGSSSRIYANVSSKSQGGNGGNLFVDARNILLTDGAYFIATSFGSGNAGNIQVHATGTITISGANENGWRSSINSSSNPKKEGTLGGKGGNISIEAGQLILKEGGAIAANSIAPQGIQSSKGGNIIIRVQGTVELSRVNPYGENEDGFGAGIYARSIGVENNAGDSGNITLQAGSLTIKDGAVIVSSTNNNAQGGNIELEVQGQIQITGDASNISLKEPADAQEQYLQGFAPSHYNQSTSGIYAHSKSSSSQAGQSGNITLTAQNLTLTHGGKISTSSAGGKQAGNIIINVAQLQLDDSASIVSESTLSNRYHFNSLAERDSHLLIAGDSVEVADIHNGKGKAGRYLNTGNQLIRITPVDSVANIFELQELAKQYNLAKGDIVEVQDIGNGQKVRFIYAYNTQYDLSEWVKIDDKVTVTLDTMSELNAMTGWLGLEVFSHASGEVIQVNDVGNGKPAIFIYSSNIVSHFSGKQYGQPLRVTFFDVADTTALAQLDKTTFIQVGDTATVMNIDAGFVFNGQNWVKLTNYVHTVTDIAELNGLALAQIGYIAEIAPGRSGQPSRFIYSGQQWLPMNDIETKRTVANLTNLNKLSAKPGDFVRVIDAGDSQYGYFFYANGQWIQQIRGGDAGQIVINADKI
ncbi:MAG: filamentous hemagglutinin N-terminal domain-containing protein [Candidatus Parabeggiatoa sp.]|nr:filamentous hemagglutinin N-terminal domain-containing protein [Candidatus Parabeggiatoa sp.]